MMNTKGRVLITDDEPGVIKFVSVGLALAGYEVIPASTGEEALRLTQSEKPDIILLDILMVPMSGFEVLDNLRSFSQVPVIVFTARSFIAEKAMKLGANGFISKPFRLDELISIIESTLEQHRPQVATQL